MTAESHTPAAAHMEAAARSTATAQIHGGAHACPTARPVQPPLHLSAAYEFDTLRGAREAFAQREAAFTYARTGSPTVALLERRIAELEGGVGAVATASGQAALALTLLALAGRSGQTPDAVAGPETPAGHVVASARIYGGTADLLGDTLAEAGIQVTWADPHAPEQWAAAVRPRTRAFLVESIGNPHADLPDVPALARTAHARGVPLVVDNTLATPHLLQPALLGADIVVHSVTKYLTGNGTALAGAVVDTGRFTPGAEPARWPQFTAPTRRFGGVPLVERYGEHGAFLHLVRAKYLHDLGPCLSPWSAQQALDGIETLDVRVDRHCRSAEELAHRLHAHPGVRAVRHPSVPDSPDAEVARRCFPRGAGAVLSFEIDGELPELERFVDALRLFKLAANIGDSRSMVSHPATMTHCRLTPELREAGDITERTLRLAVGREDVEDLWADLVQAFEAARLGEDTGAGEQAESRDQAGPGEQAAPRGGDGMSIDARTTVGRHTPGPVAHGTRGTSAAEGAGAGARTGGGPNASAQGDASAARSPDRAGAAPVRRGFATAAVHAGQEPDPLTGAVIPPIYQTSTFTQAGVETLTAGYEYSRGGNPTRCGLEEQLAALEGGAHGFAFASGIAAEDALLRSTLRPGDTVVAAAETYGGTYRLLTRLYARWGVTTRFVAPDDLAGLEAAVAAPEARIVWLETPTNPLLTIADIAHWAQAAHAHGALLVVDNTFASPALQTPLALGADAVVHSTTKYIGGHSDVLGGAVVVGDARWEQEPLAELVRFQQFAGGAVAGPQDAFLTSRGLKTLGVRLRQHCENATAVAEWLSGHPGVAQVYYPGLEGHPGHQVACRQMSGFGGTVSLRAAGGEVAARRVAEGTDVFGLSVSLGGVESLICHPATMTHGSVPAEAPEAPPRDLVRLSVGIEDVEDLVADLDRALAGR